MPPIILFVLILAGGIVILPLSRPARGLPRFILRLLGGLMIALSAFGIFTSLL